MPSIFIELEDARLLAGGEQVDGGMKTVKEGPWRDDGKYASQQIIIENDGKFYSYWVSRSGSYFSHYEYDYSENSHNMVECTQVEEYTKTVKGWRVVKDAVDHGEPEEEN